MANNNFLSNFGRHVQENFWLYLVSLLFLCTGIVLGIYTVKYMGEMDKADLSNYFLSFMKALDSKPINNSVIFIQTIKNNIPLILAVFALGATMVGVPVILIIDLIKGFSIGFTVAFIVGTMGIKGVGMALIGVMPQNLIYIPCILICSVIAMEVSFSKLKTKIAKQQSSNLFGNKAYITALLIAIGLTLVGALIESYITPTMIRYIIG